MALSNKLSSKARTNNNKSPQGKLTLKKNKYKNLVLITTIKTRKTAENRIGKSTLV